LWSSLSIDWNPHLPSKSAGPEEHFSPKLQHHQKATIHLPLWNKLADERGSDGEVRSTDDAGRRNEGWTKMRLPSGAMHMYGIGLSSVNPNLSSYQMMTMTNVLGLGIESISLTSKQCQRRVTHA
jgi:hypothetical protein